MDCNTAQRLIVLLLDNELPEKRILKLNEHLVLCPKCADEMTALRKATDAMDAWQDMQPYFSLADIKARASSLRPWWKKIHLPDPFVRLTGWSTAVGVALCICIGIVGGISMHNMQESTNHLEAVDTLITGFDDPVGDALPLMMHASFDSHQSNRRQEDRL